MFTSENAEGLRGQGKDNINRSYAEINWHNFDYGFECLSVVTTVSFFRMDKGIIIARIELSKTALSLAGSDSGFFFDCWTLKMEPRRCLEIPVAIYQSISHRIPTYFKPWLLISSLLEERPSCCSSEDWRWVVKRLGVLGDDRYLTSGHCYSSTRRCDRWSCANSVLQNSSWKFSPSDHISKQM